MKKRLLALALCLVLMTSLLPITAAAVDYDYGSVFVGLEDGGVYCEDVQFTFHPENLPDELSGAYGLRASPDAWYGVPVMTEADGVYTLHVGAGLERPSLMFMFGNLGDEAFGPSITLKNGHNWSAWTSNGDGTHSRTCGNGCVDSPQKAYCADNNADCKCDDCGASMHIWRYTRTENSLTAECGNSGCTIGKVGVTLTASSVTLPNSPFNARLEGLEQFKAAIPNAVIGDFVYKYKGPGDSEYSVVAPTAANAKAGEYQVGVRIENLTGPVESDGPVAMAFGDNQDGTWYADLYVKYTAVDPAVTAQTGDNRPIELMMASVLVFSALAAAAFILDHKRKYSR